MQDTTSTSLDPNVAHILALLGPMMLVGALILVAIYLIPLWQIVKKAGFHPALSLLVFVPLVNIIMLYVFAFSKWKVVPAPDYAYSAPVSGYPAQVPSSYPPAYPPTPAGVPPAPGYAAPGAYTPAAPAYPPPPSEPPTRL